MIFLPHYLRTTADDASPVTTIVHDPRNLGNGMEMRTTSYHLSFLAAGAASGTTVNTLGFWRWVMEMQ